MLELKRKRAPCEFRPILIDSAPIVALEERIEERISAATLIFGAAGNSAAAAQAVVLDWTNTLQNDTHTAGSYGGGSTAASEDNIVRVMNFVWNGMGFSQVPGCKVSENATSSVTVGGTAPVAGAFTSAISINASLQTTDAVDTDANGPYTVSGFPNPSWFARASVGLSAATPDTRTVGNDSGPTETITFQFSVNLSPQQADFGRNVGLLLHSTGFNVTFGAGPGSTNSFVATDPTTGTVLLSRSFDGTQSVYEEFDRTLTLAAGTTVAVDYTSVLQSGPNGTFNIGHESQQSELGWTFAITANP